MAQGVILSLGSVNIDLQFEAERWPEPEETLPANRFNLLAGGKAANIAYLTRRLRHPAWLLARVGDDELAERALRPLARAGVDLGGVCRGHDEHTGTALILVPPDGQKGILLAENANCRWTPAETRAAVARVESAPADSILVSDFELSQDTVHACLAAARSRGLRIVLDPSPAGRVPPACLRGVTAITPNAGEAEKLLGRAIPDRGAAGEAALRLHQLGARIGIVKLNDGGCMITEGGEPRYLPPPAQVRAVDTTGAGDAFTAALAVGLLERRPALEAARMGVAAARIAVTRFGSQPAYPDRPELEAMLRRFAAD